MSTQERVDIAAIVGEDIEIPCEVRVPACDAPAKWVVWTVKCCPKRQDMGLMCDPDLRHYLTTANRVRCSYCGHASEPARLWIRSYEPINVPAA